MKAVTNTLSMKTKTKATVGKLVKLCPGKRHGWYHSNVGIIRKPISSQPK